MNHFSWHFNEKDLIKNINFSPYKTISSLSLWSKINDKTYKCFINFDIVNFNPSIKRNHLLKAIKCSSKYCQFSDQEVELIMHTCRSVLWNDDGYGRNPAMKPILTWPIDSFHGAEICDLIGLYILNEITPNIDPNLGSLLKLKYKKNY